MRLLFCTDGSKISFDALEKALGLLKPGMFIDIMHIIHQNFLLQKIQNESSFDVKYEKIMEKIFKKFQKKLQEHAHFEGDKFFIHGNNNKIIEHINNSSYDLIIVGSHGYKGLSSQIGSTSRKIAEKSISPVFIARSEVNDNCAKDHIRKFLFCVDESLQSFNAITSFVKLFDVKDCEVNLITVSADIRQYPIEIASDSVWIKACLEAEDRIAEESLDKAKSVLMQSGIIVKNMVQKRGGISEEILSYVNENFQDLIVLGSHGRQGLADFLLGSVSKRVLDYCSTSVLIIPSRK